MLIGGVWGGGVRMDRYLFFLIFEKPCNERTSDFLGK